MREIERVIRRTRLSYAVSVALASLVAGNAALAQDRQVPQDPPKNAAPVQEGEMAKIKIVGTRASQQSSIQRKKNAATAIDSIVAEDVGSLPDRNIGEAISRMAGVALDRGEFGEGVNVAIRGNGPDLTRVEIDGQGVQSAGGTDNNGGSSGRGVEFRQMSADLIKSVDIVKGSTADMTEGALGGGIIIKTRSGLDFNKPFVSVRVAGTQNNLNKKWEPDTNLILADKFLDGRLGVLVNGSSSTLANESHSIQVATSGNQGYARSIDFDNSPNKTFSYLPSTLNMADPAATAPVWSYPYTSGALLNGATPQEILTKSAAAQSKADCYTAFPQWTTSSPQVQGMGTTNRNNAINARGNELLSCLAQWNDYTPSLIRNKIVREIDKRQNLDLRGDFKVNSELTVYAKGSYSKRKVDNNTLQYGLGGLNTNTAGTFIDSATGVRSAVPGTGYYLYPGTASFRSTTYPSIGTVANVDPSTVVVDANHHVTKFGVTDGIASLDQIHTETESVNKYLQLGGAFKRGGLTAEFFVGDAKSDFTRSDKRTAFSYNYGPATLSVAPNGLWMYDFPANSTYDPYNAANYAILKPAAAATLAVQQTANQNKPLPAYTIAQQPLTTQAPQVTFTPLIKATEEKTAKLDLTYATPESIPFFKRFKTGFNLRDTSGEGWGNGGYKVKAEVGSYGAAGYVPPIVVPGALIRGSLVACLDTPGSLGAGGAPCQYGWNSSGVPTSALSGQTVVTQKQFQDIIAASLSGNATATQFFNGATGRPAGLITNWPNIDVDKFLALTGAPNINFDCVKQCLGTDGKMYDQPVTRFSERSEAAYVMGDFSIDHIPFTSHALPFGLEIEGNLGYRYVRTIVHGTGQMSFTSITKTASFDPNNPTATVGISQSTFTKNTEVNAKTNDFLPIYNLAMWLVPDKVVLRYNHATTVARPPVDRLLPSGTCIYDERNVLGGSNDLDQRCTGNVGNPALQAQKNVNQNLSLEYYPNKDTMFTVAAFQQDGKVGPNIVQGVTGVNFFQGSTEVDPVTGVKLADLKFDYNTFLNGAATKRKGLEFGTKTAFTFLPWFLRYTGFDANYTKLRSATTSQNLVDLLTGDPLPVARESKYSYNYAVWYDDGKLSARVAVQAVASYFNYIAANGGTTVNNYPALGVTRTTVIPYNPGSPDFKDSTRFIDGKISYKIRPNIELFVEGRNLGNATQSNSQGPYAPFADGTPNLLDYAYVGRRIMVGVNFRNM
jgi:TonB-dependent receptor